MEDVVKRSLQNKKATLAGRLILQNCYSLENGDVLCLPAFGALYNAELDCLAFLQ